METTTIYLEAARDGDRLKIGLARPGASISSYSDIFAPMEAIERRCRELVEMLNMAGRTGSGRALPRRSRRWGGCWGTSC